MVPVWMYTMCDDWRAHQSPYAMHVPSHCNVLKHLGWNVSNVTSVTSSSISLWGGHATLIFCGINDKRGSYSTLCNSL